MKRGKNSPQNEKVAKSKKAPAKKGLSKKSLKIKGTIHVHPKGFGFVTVVDSRYPEDIFIPKKYRKNAFDGDEVLIEVNPVVSVKGAEGVVLEVVKRKKEELVAYVAALSEKGEPLFYSPQIEANYQIVLKEKKKHKFSYGDRLLLKVLDWEGEGQKIFCKVAERFAPITEPLDDVKVAVKEFSIRENFSQHIKDEVAVFGTRVSAKEIKQRKDFRHLETVTIDPKTAKDFDDAISLEGDLEKGYTLYVHIADVSHYVAPHSFLDKEAQERSNSTYFPGTCVPMLPKELSENLCSLKPKVNRLAVSVVVDFSKEGDVTSYRIEKSVIKSQKRFTYEEAKAVLDGKRTSPYKPLLVRMTDLCALLKKKRQERGSIDFSLDEKYVVVDAAGVPQKMEVSHYDITHQMIEEFMLKANEVVATHLHHKGIHLPFRVHETPDLASLDEFGALVRSFDYDFPFNPMPEDFQKLFSSLPEGPTKSYLTVSYIKCMKLATYSPDNIGHYGLGLEYYCHFTSPIRRYVDLIAHRLLFHDPVAYQELETIAFHASERERNSAKAEQSVALLKKMRLLQKVQEKHPKMVYNAVITKIKPFGLSFELVEYNLEGSFSFSDLSTDYFVYDSENSRLVGQRRGVIYHSGLPIKVRLREIDLVKRMLGWKLYRD